MRGAGSRLLLTWGLLAAAYVVCGKVGLLFAATQENVTLVWAPSGLALAALLLGGYHVWPGVALGAFLVNVTTQVPVAAALGITCGNTLEAVAGAWLLRRVGFDRSLNRVHDVLALVGLAAICATTVSATWGVAALWVSSAARLAECPQLWLYWWSGDALGVLLVAPAILTWAARRRLDWGPAQAIEAAALATALAVVGLIVFGWVQRPDTQLAFVLFPFLIWAALRFSQRETVALTLLAATIAVGGTAHGLAQSGQGETFEQRYVYLHVFLGVTAVSAMLLGAVLAERAKATEEVRQSAGLLRAVVDGTTDAVFVKDLEGRYLLFNEAAARFVGRPVEDVLGKGDADLFDPPSALLVMEQDRLVMASGRTVTAEEELTAAGMTRTFHATKAPYRDGQGRIIGVVGVSRDVTQRKVDEERLRRSEERLRAVVETTPACIKVVAADGTLLDMNAVGLAMVEADRLEMVQGKCVYDLIAAEDRDAYRAFHERVCRGEKASLEFEIVGLRGRRCRVETHAAPLQGSDDSLMQLAITLDITERRRAGEALRQSEELFRTAFEDTNVAMVLTDPEHNFLRVNEAFARLFGYSQEQMLGMAMSQVTHPDDLSESLARRVPLQAGEADYFQMEKRYLHRDGSVFWGLANVTAVRGGTGRVALYVGQVKDITSRKRAEEANAKYVERLRVLHQIDRTLIAGEGPAAIAAAALPLLRTLLGVNRAVVNLFDLAKGEVEWLAAAGRKRVRVGPGVHYSIRFMGDVDALRRGEPQSIDVHTLPPGGEVDALLASGVRAYLVVPMIAAGELIGALTLGAESLPSSPDQLDIAQEVATQFAIALAQARLYESVKRQAQELEVRIAERNQAEEGLRLFRTLIDRTNDTVEVIDPWTGRFLDVNETACLAHGYTREEYLALTVADVDPLVAAQTWEEASRQVRQAGFLNLESLHCRKDGSTFPVEVSVNYVRLDREYMLAVVRDVTERKRADQALRQEREFIRLILDTDPNLIFVKDAEGRFVLANKALADLYGTTPEALVGRRAGEGLPALAELTEYRRVEADVLRAGRPIVREETNTRPDGRVLHFHTVKAPLRLPDGTTHVLGIAADITERKQAETSLAERMQLASLVADIGVALTRGGRPTEILNRCAEALVRHLGAAFARIWTLDEGQSVLELQASAGLYTHLDGPHSRVRVGQFKIGLIAQQRRPHLTNQVVGDPHVSDQEWARREGMVAFAGYPLLVADRLVGVVALFARQALSETTIQSMAAVADQIAVGIERVRAEVALQRERNLLRTLIDALPDVVYTKDVVGRFAVCNSALLRLCGLAHEDELVGKTVFDLFPREMADGFNADDLAVIAGGQVLDREELCVDAEGDRRWFLTIKVPLRDHAGAVVALVGISRDVTERKKADEALRAAQQRLQHVVGSSPAVLYTLALAGGQIRGITWVSDNLHEMLGYAPEDARSLDWWMSNIHPEDRDRVIADTHERLLSLGRASHDYRFRHRDGRYLWTRGEIRLMGDALGQAAEAVGSWSDVTGRKEIEEQLAQAQKMEAVGQLAGGVAHDFNNMLTVINGYSEVLLSSLPEGNGNRKLIEEVLRAGERAAVLTRQLLTFSRKEVVRPTVIDVNETLGGACGLLRRLIGEDVKVAVEPGEGVPLVLADPGQLGQVLMNLCLNARDAMPTGGSLTIRTRRQEVAAGSHPEAQSGRHAVLSVSDTGTGMTAEVMTKIFEPFFTTKEAGKGTGLGLAVVHGIVKQAGGHVRVDSEVGRGTTFEVYLPATEWQAASVCQATVSARGAGEVVLLVEDEEAVRRLAALVLRSNGYSVLEAECGEEALRALEGADRIDLLVTDVVMPGMSGRELVEQVRGRLPRIEVVYCSGYTDDAIVCRGVRQDQVNFLQKPYTPTSLLAAVRAALDRS